LGRRLGWRFLIVMFRVGMDARLGFGELGIIGDADEESFGKSAMYLWTGKRDAGISKFPFKILSREISGRTGSC